MVKEAGLSKAFRMDLADVLVKAEDAYHMTHSIYSCKYQHEWPGKRMLLGSLGISYYELGRDGSTKSSGNLVGILAHTPSAHTYVPEGLVDDALLAPMTTATAYWLAW